MIIRKKYLEQIEGFYDSDLIKIITGIRWCGKSIILEQIINEIRKKSKNIIYLNFEDEKTINEINDSKSLMDYVTKNIKKGKCYLFCDEIQELKEWPLACKTLRLYDVSIFITGSNSKILSSEFTDYFSGRYVSFRIRPFVYKEMLEYATKLNVSYSVNDYLIWGGIPKQLEFKKLDDRKRYLNDIYDSIVYKDLIARFKVSNVELFKKITNYILLSNSRIFSAIRIEKYLKEEKLDGSINTIIKYINYLDEAYIIERIKPYSNSIKKELQYYFKVYNEDVGFNSILHLDNRYDLNYNLENIVYNELIYMGYNVMVYSKPEAEVDFLCIKDNKKYYIQVCYSLVEDKTYEREFRAFDIVKPDGKKIIISTDEIDYSTSIVEHINIKDFLKRDNLD